MDTKYMNDLFIGYVTKCDYFDPKLKRHREKHIWDTEEYNVFTSNLNNLNNYNNLYRTQDAPKWEPTPDEIRECCGVWLHKNNYTLEIRPDNLSIYHSIEHFISTTNLLSKLEPIPEQCIPKPEPERERYEWAGIVEEWM